MIKELQYFYIAYLVCQNRSWWLLATIDALAVIIIGNGIRLLLAGKIAYYGIGTFGTDSPSLSGALYFFSTIWLHIRSKLIRSRPLRWTTLFVVALGFVCVIATVSRTSIAATIVYLVTYLILTSIVSLPAFMVAAGITPKLIQIAAAGQFDLAIGVCREAIDKAEQAQRTDAANAFREALTRYESLKVSESRRP